MFLSPGTTSPRSCLPPWTHSLPPPLTFLPLSVSRHPLYLPQMRGTDGKESPDGGRPGVRSPQEEKERVLLLLCRTRLRVRRLFRTVRQRGLGVGVLNMGHFRSECPPTSHFISTFPPLLSCDFFLPLIPFSFGTFLPLPIFRYPLMLYPVIRRRPPRFHSPAQRAEVNALSTVE